MPLFTIPQYLGTVGATCEARHLLKLSVGHLGIHSTTLFLCMFENFTLKKLRENHLFTQKRLILLLSLLNVHIIVFVNITGSLLLLSQHQFRGEQAVSVGSQTVSVSGFKGPQAKLRILCMYKPNKKESISTSFLIG